VSQRDERPVTPLDVAMARAVEGREETMGDARPAKRVRP